MYNESPVLTTVIPAYNAQSTIGRAVASARATGAVVVVVDDGSYDATAEVAESAGAKVIVQSNAGAAVARRTGFQSVGTEFVNFLDADDELIASGVRASIDVLATTDAGVVGGLIVGVSAKGQRVPIRQWRSPITVTELLKQGHSPGAPGALVWRRDVLAIALDTGWKGVWPRYAEDYELLIRGASLAPVVLHARECLNYALEGGKSTLDPTRAITCSEEIRAWYSTHLGIPIRRASRRNIKGRGLVRQAKSTRTAGDTRKWVTEIGQALVCDPRFVLALAAKGFMSRVRGRLRRPQGDAR